MSLSENRVALALFGICTSFRLIHAGPASSSNWSVAGLGRDARYNGSARDGCERKNSTEHAHSRATPDGLADVPERTQ